jgi:hypothetical protein
MPGDGGAGIPCRTAVPIGWTTEEQQKNNRRPTKSSLAARVWGLRAASGFVVPCRGTYMTSFGMYERQNEHMLIIELARIIQADREREIEARLRQKRILRSTETPDTTRRQSPSIRPTQRPASTAAASR